ALTLQATITESGADAESTTRAPASGSTVQGQIQNPEQVLQALGIQVRDLSVPERMRGFRGVVVTAVAENGLAVDRVQAGDLVLAVNHSRISGAREFFVYLAASAAAQATGLHLIREGQLVNVTLPPVPQQN
ncbi:hypothetical protein HQ447_19665, partial [bacterium]|nr:hypothetical protein [bacterium]